MSVIGHPSARAEHPDRTAPDGLGAALIGLGVLGILGSAVQLAAPGSAHLLPWGATILLATAAALLTLPRVGRPGRHAARALSLIVLVSAATAVAEHLAAGPGVPVGSFTHSWYGGGTAPLAPGLLGQSALLLLLASLRAGPQLGRFGRRVAGRLRRGADRG
ncbi:hypothetical protein EV383_5817 [Pseudonocardia sediminis]|uniref:Uncharacterized protein n=1 Tax=Pseudonocardia sediminis TaxID=1397368 RepID=A0A4Q7V5T5_PSEST|nr:hypothetical protein [Pseudonocardia sediminis]RZT88864.1 hypothetical protein EV383_5817 [Pseudonocardia sediminis]